MDTLISILFTGMALAAVLYLVSVGLSITMGLLGVVNLAHGSFAMMGGYITFELVNEVGLGFAPSVIIAALAVAAASVVIERLIYAPVYDAGDLEQVLITIGLVFVSIAIAHYLFGSRPLSVAVPDILRGQLVSGTHSFSIYRIFLIGLVIVIHLLLWVTIERTDLGARIRAVVDNRSMAESTGINTKALFIVVFALGCGIAALGGALGSVVIGLTPSYPLKYLPLFLIVVAVGGAGTVSGTAYASLLLGIGDSACKTLAPEFGGFFIYVATFFLLLWRPEGLFPRQAV